MTDIIGPRNFATTNMNPLDAHIAHLRHLSKPKTAELILRKRFKYSGAESKSISKILSPYVEQALEFYDASIITNNRIRPVLQYYAFLNFAVAVILAYKPPNHERHKQHGIHDRTSKLKSLSLSSMVVEIDSRPGVIPLFHSIISEDSLYKRKFKLNELMGAIPILSLEMKDVFKVDTYRISTHQCIRNEGKGGDKQLSEISFKLHQVVGCKLVSTIPRGRLERAIPFLTTEYKCNNSKKTELIYQSIKHFILAEESKLQDYHIAKCMKSINIGAHDFSNIYSRNGPEILYLWYSFPRIQILPVMSAALMLSFNLASIVRYRPTLVSNLEDSMLNVMADIYTREIDGIMIPAFRNLLYKEELFFQSKEYL